MTLHSASDVQALIAGLYAAFNRRDIDAVLSRLSPDVVWPNGWEGGTVTGHAAVRDYWTRQWAQIDPTVIPERVAVDPDGRVEVTVRQRVEDRKGALLSEGLVRHIYRFEGGQVASMEIGPPA